LQNERVPAKPERGVLDVEMVFGVGGGIMGEDGEKEGWVVRGFVRQGGGQ